MTCMFIVYPVLYLSVCVPFVVEPNHREVIICAIIRGIERYSCGYVTWNLI